MMKRIIIHLIGLFVLGVFPELSVAMPPLRSDHYDISHFSIQSPSTGITTYESGKLNYSYYYDGSQFHYSLVTSKGEKIFENKGKNTEIVFLFDTKMQMYANGNENVLYTLDLPGRAQARVFVNRIITSIPTRYKECSGSDTYKIGKLYDSTGGDHLDMANNWCIFKERKGNVTTLTIKWMGDLIRHQDPIGIFRRTDYKLTRVPGVNNKLELGILFNRVPLGPRYILETSTPEELEAFMK